MARWRKTLALLATLWLGSWPAAAGSSLTVVELFTSQGCSSCPPANAFLGELAERDDLLALSFHVDYWDYIGWKDVFASPVNSRRQRDYARSLGFRYVFTPQMVIQGAAQATGTDRAAILGGVSAQQKHSRVPLTLGHGADSGTMTVAMAAVAGGEPADVWLAVFDHERITPVKSGENRGRAIHNFNVVRDFRHIAVWRGEALEISASLPEVAVLENDACAVIVQSRRTGRILGAAKIAIKGE
jgi:hypothetical protein